jgi:hypothetical protein
MKGGADKARQYPLSDGDIRQLLGDDIALHVYPDLSNYRQLDEIFDSKGRSILLFLTTSANSGHWCCLLRKKDRVEFFDPYGDPPESQLDDLPPSYLERLDQATPYLANLLKTSKVPVYFNTHSFQKLRGDVATCGRHCVVRCLYAPYTLEQ